jgi:hypothetical protein
MMSLCDQCDGGATNFFGGSLGFGVDRCADPEVLLRDPLLFFAFGSATDAAEAVAPASDGCAMEEPLTCSLVIHCLK